MPEMTYKLVFYIVFYGSFFLLFPLLQRLLYSPVNLFDIFFFSYGLFKHKPSNVLSLNVATLWYRGSKVRSYKVTFIFRLSPSFLRSGKPTQFKLCNVTFGSNIFRGWLYALGILFPWRQRIIFVGISYNLQWTISIIYQLSLDQHTLPNPHTFSHVIRLTVDTSLRGPRGADLF